MFDKEELMGLFRKGKNLKNKKNTVNFIPRQTLCVKINNMEYYISLICDDNFKVKVVLLDTNSNIIYQLLELDGDRASITKVQNNLYVFTEENAYIYDINNLKNNPRTLFLGNLDIQGICSNQNYIYAYSIAKDKIIKYDQNLISIQEYANHYSTDNIRVSLSLACNEKTFFSIPIMTPTEEQYILMKRFMEQYVGYEIAKQNDQIHSCTFNSDENTLYISMYNIIWIIKDGIEFSYLYFKERGMTTILYDNDIKRLIVNFGGTNGKYLCGAVLELSDSELKEKAIPITDISTTTFHYSQNIVETANNLLSSNSREAGIRRK